MIDEKEFTISYDDQGRHVEVSVIREPFGWVMRSGGVETLLGIRAMDDLVLRAALALAEEVRR